MPSVVAYLCTLPRPRRSVWANINSQDLERSNPVLVSCASFIKPCVTELSPEKSTYSKSPFTRRLLPNKPSSLSERSATIPTLLQVLLCEDNRLEVEVYRRFYTNSLQEQEGVQLTVVRPHDVSKPYVWSEIRVDRRLQAQHRLIVHETPQSTYHDFIQSKLNKGYERRASYTVHTEPTNN